MVRRVFRSKTVFLRRLMMKKICIFFMIFSIVMTMCACDRFHPYKGDRYDLLTVATNSLLGCDGKIFMNSQGPTLEIIEEDDYGRVLFYYYEKSSFSAHSYIICQKYNDELVYYYPDYNFISSAENDFSNEDINQLKIINDWNEPLNYDQMTSSKIVKSKVSPDVSDDIFEKITKDYIGEKYDFRYAEYCYSDKHGTSLYVLSVINLDDSTSETLHYVVILSKDLSCSEGAVTKIDDYYNYQDKIAELKFSNGWQN